MSDLIERLRDLGAQLCESRNLFGIGASLKAAADALEANAKRIAELEAHGNELAATCHARDETIHKHWCKVMELESEVARLRVDGERYAWLREHCNSMSVVPPLTVAKVCGHGLEAWSGDDLDAAIYAHLNKSGE